MIGTILSVYGEMLSHYNKKWRNDKIDEKYKNWEKGQDLRKDYGFDDKVIQRIPKKKIRNRGARKYYSDVLSRKKHAY